MGIRNRIYEQQIRLGLIVGLILLGIYSCSVSAQSERPIKYIGFQVSFGDRSFKLNSNIKKIDQMQAGHEGGSLGIVFGNEVLKTRLRVAGVFYSNANTPQTQRLFETSVLSNFYPIAIFKNQQNARLQPYLTAGFSLDKIKFFGTYLDNQPTSSGYEPYLGKISQIMAQGGIGLEYRLTNQVDFIHLFAEALFGAPIQSQASNAFAATSIEQFTTINVGVSFGRKR